MSKKKKIAICGAGRIFRRHVEAISQLGNEFQIVAVADTDAARLEDVPSLLSSAERYASIEAMMKSESDLSLVSVLVDSGRHFRVAMELLKFGVPTLVEKPLALSSADAISLVESYENSDVPLFVVKQNRLNAAVQELERQVSQGSIGQVNLVLANVLWCRRENYYLADPWRMSKRTDGGVIWNQASHYIDLLQRILGPVREVSAYGRNFLSPADSEDTVIVNFSGARGNLGNMVATTTVRPQNFEGSLTVIGETGLLRVGGHALNSLESFTEGREHQQTMADLLSNEDVYGTSHSLVYQSVFRHLEGLEESQFLARGTLHGIDVMEAIDKSIASGRPASVRLDRQVM